MKYAMPDAVQYHPVRLCSDFRRFAARLSMQVRLVARGLGPNLGPALHAQRGYHGLAELVIVGAVSVITLYVAVRLALRHYFPPDT